MRIWVTGVGIVSPLGLGASVTMDRICDGERAMGPLTVFELPDTRAQIAAEVKGIDVGAIALPGQADTWSRTDAMAVLAAREALDSAKLSASLAPLDLIVGGTVAGMREAEGWLAAFSHDPASIRPVPILRAHPLTSPPDRVHDTLGPFRRVRAICSACSSGANAILLAAIWLRSGASTRVLAGGADGLCKVAYSGFSALGAIDPEPCKPFDLHRRGLSIGEGAAFLVLETEAAARSRSAAPLAELRGWAIGSEAHHITNPEPDGRVAASVVRAAIACAGLTPADVDYVNAHGTATPHNDVMEAIALRNSLGDDVRRVAVSSTKGQIGHTLGAAGALEAGLTVLAIERGVIPPTAGLSDVDPACADLVHVREKRTGRVRSAVSSSFGFGGMDNALLFAEIDAFPNPLDPPAFLRVVVTGAGTIGPLGAGSSAASRAYLDPGPSPDPGAITFRPADHLDPWRSRRHDRSARFAAAAVEVALGEAGLAGVADVRSRAGVVLGSAFGGVDASTAYLRRLHERGARFASPADFPNLLPSSPAGHVSIYAGLRGPALTVADLNVTAEQAIATAADLVAGSVSPLIVGGSVEETSPVVERALGPVCEGLSNRGPRSEGASVLVLEDESHALRRGARPLATLRGWAVWRGEGAGITAAMRDLPNHGLPPPPARALVVVGRDPAAARVALAGTSWAEVPIVAASDRAGDHEGAGGFAAAAAIGAIAKEDLEAALVLGLGPNRCAALLFWRWSPSDGGASE